MSTATRPAPDAVAARRGPGPVPVVLAAAGLVLAIVGVRAVLLTPLPSSTDSPGLVAVAAGLALVGLALCWRSAARATVALLGALVVGQAASLQLVVSPRFAVYQHLVSWRQLAGARPWLLALIALQILLCVVVAARRAGRRGVRPADGAAARSSHMERVRAVWGRPTWLLGALLILGAPLCLAVPTESVGRFAGELAMAAMLAAIGLGNLLLIAAMPSAQALERAWGWLGERITLEPGRPEPRRWDRRLPWVAASWTAVSAALVSVFVLERLPHIDDAVAYLFQARTFASGHLVLPAPADSAAFSATYLINDGVHWYSKYFPGWPAVLAVGARLGVPWLVNPLLGGAAVLLAHVLVRRLYDRRTAHAAALLLCLSPWVLFMSGAYMSHPVSLVWLLVALLAVERAAGDRRRLAWAALGGVAVGALLVTRPLEAVLVAPVIALWALFGPSRPRPAALMVALGAAAGIALLLLGYDKLLTGRALYAPHTLWSDRTWGPGRDVIGFGPHVGITAWPNLDPLPGHGLADVVLNLNKNLYMLWVDLFGWACGSLLVVVAFLVPGRRRAADWLMVGLAAAIMLGHSIYWFAGGPDLGARYWYLAVVPLVVLTVRGGQILARRLAESGTSAAGRRVAVFLAAASLAALVTVVPWRAATKYYRYREISGEVRTLSQRLELHHALVFVRARERKDYQEAFSLNAIPLDRSDVVYALDTGSAGRAAVRRRFPDRAVWIIERPSEDSAGYGVVAAPPGR